MPHVVLIMGFGVFGKFPGAGDFVRSGLAQGFVEPWDAWLQRELPGARAALGSRWQGCYLSAPIWRFSLAPGVAGPSAMLGVLMPSVDRVGRQFPLTLAAPVSSPAAPPDHVALHLAAHVIFGTLEDAALAMLDDRPLSELQASLAAIDLPATPVLSGNGALRIDHADDPAPALAAAHLGPGLPALFTARLDSGFRLLRPAGLPRAAVFTALFDTEAPVWSAAA